MPTFETRILPFRRRPGRECSPRSTTKNPIDPDCEVVIAARRLSRLLALRRIVDGACLRAQLELRARIVDACSDHDPTAA